MQHETTESGTYRIRHFIRGIQVGALAMEWEAEQLPAILQAWYPGQNGGTAVADILFGNDNPAGRLPITFYRSTDALPDFIDYSMENRTYRYFNGQPLYPFGHGLSYTRFEYGDLQASTAQLKADGEVKVRFRLKNTGALDGDEVVQLYVRHLSSPVPQPSHSLAAFKWVFLEVGETDVMELTLPASALRYWIEDADHYTIPLGKFEIQVGSSSADIRKTLILTLSD